MIIRLGFTAGLSSALALLGATACTRHEIEGDLDRAHAGSREIVRRVDEGLDRAKQRAGELRAKLPASEKVESSISAAKAAVTSTLEAARGRVGASMDRARESQR